MVRTQLIAAGLADGLKAGISAYRLKTNPVYRAADQLVKMLKAAGFPDATISKSGLRWCTIAPTPNFGDSDIEVWRDRQGDTCWNTSNAAVAELVEQYLDAGYGLSAFRFSRNHELKLSQTAAV